MPLDIFNQLIPLATVGLLLYLLKQIGLLLLKRINRISKLLTNLKLLLLRLRQAMESHQGLKLFTVLFLLVC